MKNKILITLLGIILLAAIFTLPTYAAEANVVLEKNPSANNKVKVLLEVSEEQSVTKANVVLDVKTANKSNLKNAEFAWSDEISNNSETAKWTYNNDKVNLYVISKNELGNKSSDGKKVIELGTLTINTNSNEQTSVDISTANGGVTIASVDHKTANISNDTSTSAQLVIGTATQSGNEQGGNNNPPSGNNNNQSGNNNQSSGNNSSGNSGNNQSSGNSNNSQNNSGNNNQSSGNGSTGGSNNSSTRRPNTTNGNNNVNNNEIEDDNNNVNEINTNEIDNTTNTIKNETTNKTQNNVQSSRDLPDTGEEKEEKSYIWLVVLVIILAVALVGIAICKAGSKKKHRGNYRV